LQRIIGESYFSLGQYDLAEQKPGSIRGGFRKTAEKLLREAARIRTESAPETHFLRATANGALEFLPTQPRFS
jgi:hypothetical protein